MSILQASNKPFRIVIASLRITYARSVHGIRFTSTINLQKQQHHDSRIHLTYVSDSLERLTFIIRLTDLTNILNS